jgi:hypothetical protein
MTRAVFRQLVVGSMAAKRDKYEAVLERMPIFVALGEKVRAPPGTCLVSVLGPVAAKQGDCNAVPGGMPMLLGLKVGT